MVPGISPTLPSASELLLALFNLVKFTDGDRQLWDWLWQSRCSWGLHHGQHLFKKIKKDEQYVDGGFSRCQLSSPGWSARSSGTGARGAVDWIHSKLDQVKNWIHSKLDQAKTGSGQNWIQSKLDPAKTGSCQNWIQSKAVENEDPVKTKATL